MGQNDRGTKNVIIYNENGVSELMDANGISIDAGLDYGIAKGLISGATNGAVHGYVATASTSITVLRATSYTERSSEAQLEVVSSSASDTSAGTGTRTVRVTYFDGSMNGPFTEDKTMNGTGAVTTTATNIRFVEKIESLTIGSNGTNVGTITLRAAGGGATVGTIAVSDGITFWAHHYVATGKTCFINKLIAGSSGNSGNVFIRAIPPLTSNAFEKQITPSVRSITAQISQIYDMENYIVTGPARITVYVKADSSTAATFLGGLSYHEL